MAADRDLAVAFVRARNTSGTRDLTGWEVTAATGVRGLRLLGEAGAFGSFTLTEANEMAFVTLARNCEGKPGARPMRADGRVAPDGGPFDYVDVDPYGSPAPFLEASIRAVRAGGVLAATATDMMVLAGAQPSATRRRYGATPVRGRLGPESGLRILLMFVAKSARAQGRSIRPLLAYVREHYVRAYVEVNAAADAPDPVGTIDPTTWDGPDVGSAGPFGPIWLGPLFDPPLVARLSVPDRAARPREVGEFLARIAGEASLRAAFYYEPNRIGAALRLATPPSPDALIAALREGGFRAARTHVRPEGVRTDAPRPAVYRVARSLDRSGQSQNARVRA